MQDRQLTRQLTKVALVTETFAPEINGVANTLSNLVSGLLEKGIQIQIIRPRQSKADHVTPYDDPQHQGLSSLTLPGLPIPGYAELKFGLPLSRRIRKLWRKDRPEAIYVATEGPLGWAAVRVAKKLGIPVLSGFHTNFHQYSAHYLLPVLKPLVFKYLRHFHNQTAGTLVPTAKQQNELELEGFLRVSILSRGVDNRLFNPAQRNQTLRQQWDLKKHEVGIIYVGRLAVEKNIDLAIRAFEAMRATQSNLRFILVGDGPMRDKLAEEHPDYILCGMKTGIELAEHYASGDIFLFPSQTETFGNVVTEALASGLAVVAYDYAAAQTHIDHERSGILVPFGDESAFIKAAVALLDRPNQLNDIKYEARHQAESISWPKVVDEFAQQLTNITQSLNPAGYDATGVRQ